MAPPDAAALPTTQWSDIHHYNAHLESWMTRGIGPGESCGRGGPQARPHAHKSCTSSVRNMMTHVWHAGHARGLCEHEVVWSDGPAHGAANNAPACSQVMLVDIRLDEREAAIAKAAFAAIKKAEGK